MTKLEKKVDTLINLCLCDDEENRKELMKCLRELIEEDEKSQPVDYHTKVADAILELGTPDSIKGHKYLIYAIELAIANPKVIEQITKVLYPEVAEKFDTTPSRVERAMRHAIENTWDRADFDVLKKYFGNTVHPCKGKPTNSEFLARMANALR